MKVIGLIGGMSWESSVEYYRVINERVKEKAGGLHSAKSVMFSVDFHEVEILQQEGRWSEAAALLIDAARRVERAGADCLVLCTNTMHRVAGEIEAAIRIPLLHIADATAEKVQGCGMTKVGLLGTKYTMEQDFYKGRLTERYGIDVVVPTDADRQFVHDVIYDELCLGRILDPSRQTFLRIIDDMTDRGAEGIILGCTEIPLLVREEDTRVPLFDTTRIHAHQAVAFAMQG